MAQPVPVPPHRARFPDPAGQFKTLPPSDQAYMRELVAALQRELDIRRAETRAQSQILLIDPTGKTWSLKINASGSVLATPVGPTGVLP